MTETIKKRFFFRYLDLALHKKPGLYSEPYRKKLGLFNSIDNQTAATLTRELKLIRSA